MLAEGPARIEDGKVRVMVAAEGRSAVRVGALTALAVLQPPTDEDLFEQELLAKVRAQAAQRDAEAVGCTKEMLNTLGEPAAQQLEQSLAAGRGKTHRCPEQAQEKRDKFPALAAYERVCKASTKGTGSYKKRKAAVDRLALFPKLITEIDAQRAAMQAKKCWDQNSAEWRAHVKKVARSNFGGTDAEWATFAAVVLEPYADRFWEAGCDAPHIKNFQADIVPKPGAKPSARRPFKLSQYDDARLEWRCQEFEESGQLYRVPPQEAGEWASPAFIVDKIGDILGRLVTDYEGPNRETEDHPGVPADAAEVLRKASGMKYHTVMDMVWGFSQIELSERAQHILTIVTRSGLRRWRYLPMGPQQGPGICQGFNDHAFGDLEQSSIFVDDFHTGSPTFEEHLASLVALLERGRHHGVQWRLSKCVFCQTRVVLIGFEVSDKARTPDPAKVAALEA